MPADDKMPEGTDSIIEGAGVSAEDDDLFEADDEAAPEPKQAREQNAGSSQRTTSSEGGSGDFRAMFFDRLGDVRGQAGDKARDFALAGKDRATSALDEVVRMVEDAAAEIDAKIGTQYGDYARRAADGIGSFSDSFRDKDVDALFTDARDLVKRSPAVAIGAAAAIGFVVARLARAGVAEAGGADGGGKASRPA